ncbi:MAG: hypothetical protein FJX92_00410 [Bacteroidetes bacterium]|nr:hypothetical protein [Bacteroidota bacterium]
MIRRFGLCLFLFPLLMAQGQGVAWVDSTAIPRGFKPDFRRERNHELVDQEQTRLLATDGMADDQFDPLHEPETRDRFTRAFVRQVDWLQYRIETDSTLEHREKMSQLYGLEYLIRQYRRSWMLREGIPVNEGVPLIEAYATLLRWERQRLSIRPLFSSLSYEGGMALLGSDRFLLLPGYAEALNDLVIKYCRMYPDRILSKLQFHPNVAAADSLIEVVAQRQPRLLYDYAAANDLLSVRIRFNNNPAVKVIAVMAGSKSGQQYFSFLDQIIKGKLSFLEIDQLRDDTLGYYRLLVKTQLSYWSRALQGDTALEFAALTQRLEKKANEGFVYVINGLHNDPPSVRFACLQKLTAEELYYLAVSSDGVIYTSSFVKGIYPLMMQRIGRRGDSLLNLVQFDRYRKFIKMAAGYNTLGDFLGTFPAALKTDERSEAETLMRNFVSRLELTSGLESGVDVADSYASIRENQKPIADQMLIQVNNEFSRNQAAGNQRGAAIYRILQVLFRSADSAQRIDLTKELGIPPVYKVPHSLLVNNSGQIVIQLFFYGDTDGKNIFQGFLKMFNPANWRVDESNPQWVEVRSRKGRSVMLFANRPLDEETGADDQAQAALTQFLRDHDLSPTITIHRGHSYFAPSTISRLSPSSRIVFLGSCGGYHLIHDVLKKATDAHIIASKQIGATSVNRPFLSLLTEKLRLGKDIDWIPFWKELDRMVTVKEFDDYIPPYKNLGALFIKAYQLEMESQE